MGRLRRIGDFRVRWLLPHEHAVQRQEECHRNQSRKDTPLDPGRSACAPTPELQAAQAKWESEFPLELKWNGLKPDSVKHKGAEAKIADDGTVLVPTAATNSNYTVELPLAAGNISALRLDALA